jgi:pimeloyl-ACP methyl ester carboxylesterase
VVVFLHGFPEIWYSWRHQMIALANVGFRAIAPDHRGYGLSDRPPPQLNKASFVDLITDLLTLLDALQISKVLKFKNYMKLFKKFKFIFLETISILATNRRVMGF